MPAPVALVSVDPCILSSYQKSGGTGGPRETLIPLYKLGKAGVAHPATAEALLALHHAVTAAGGDFRVTELHRDVAVQKIARAKYDAWVRAGKPPASSPAFDAKAMKAAYVATPGRSGHNAGRSIDIDLASLKFPGIAADKQLDKLWECAIPLGWAPVIKEAKEGASESWHFDCWSDLKSAKDRLGYEQACLIGAILVGHGDLESYAAIVQALLQRAGFDIGPVDGLAGQKTTQALMQALGVNAVGVTSLLANQDQSIFAKLLALPAK